MPTVIKDFCEEVIIAGFGGQGIILVGKLLAQTAMMAGKEVTYMPSYGAEIRGGTANSMIIFADEPIACPTVSRPDSAIIMNKASLKKFAPRLKSPGLLIYNSSLIEQGQVTELDSRIDVLAVPADELACELGAVKSANMIMLGAYLQKKNVFGYDLAAKCLKDVLVARYHKTIPLNTDALKRGAEFARNNC
ncbi:MAG: 2-oxoacid:acceptor oxidoreductase family protein [Planctomycetota bacterium]|jgi:2-oxoglutarate ferredoxin oxidoreductase subunit gamma